MTVINPELADARFDAAQLERALMPLDELGRAVWLPAIVNTESPLLPRVAALAAWRRRLLTGDAALVPADGWPGNDVADAFNEPLCRLGVGDLARHQAGVVEQIQRHVLWHVDRIALLCERLPRAAAVALCAAAFADDWERRGEEFRQVLRVFDSLDGVVNFARWSELQGLLQTDAWQAVLQARDRIADMPKLAALIARLGRERPMEAESRQSVAHVVAHPDQSHWVRRYRNSPMPGSPIETDGIRRSGELGSLLASEMILLRGRRRLLAARIAEQTLLSYHQRQSADALNWSRESAVPRQEQTRHRPILGRGPLILCVDTSASMQGAPERVAKAVVLEAARVAQRERRACLLYAWSGPGNLVRQVLSGDEGVFEIARFLAASFHGGTDVTAVFERILADLEQPEWRQADVLLASDGEFGATPAVLAQVGGCRERLGLKVQGVLIGDRQTMGLRQLCDDIHWVRDWRRYGHFGQTESPAHSSRLTALYFPAASQEPFSAVTALAADRPGVVPS